MKCYILIRLEHHEQNVRKCEITLQCKSKRAKNMGNIKENTSMNVKVVIKNGKYGVTDLEGNVVVPFGKYAWIDGFDHGLARVHSYGITKIKNGECHQYKVSPLKIVDGEIVANPEGYHPVAVHETGTYDIPFRHFLRIGLRSLQV